MKTKFGDDLRTVFDAAKSEAERITGDRNLSESGKAAKRREVQLFAASQARDAASVELAARRAQVARAGEVELEARRRDRAREDPTRALLALRRAELAATTANWDQVQQAVEFAVSTGDSYDLKAWQTVMPSLAKRFGVESVDASMAVENALVACEHPDVASARLARETAESSLQQAADDLEQLGFEADFFYDRQQAAALREALTGPPAGPVTVDTGDGGYYITSGDAGRGWM